MEHAFQNNIRLIISDLDGTLLDHEHKLTQETIETLQTINRMGIDFWIATGRHHADATTIRDKLNIPCRLITANGATISDVRGDLVKQYAFEAGLVEQLLQIPFPAGVYQNLYQGQHWLTQELDEVFKDYYNEGDFSYTLCNFKDYLDKPINKMFYTSLNHDLLLPLASHIKTEFGTWVDVTFSMPLCLEVMPKGVNKGRAITDLLKEIGLDASEVIAFGDGMNDLEMLAAVGCGHILENANPNLKKALPQCKLIGHHANSAVAKQLQAYFNLIV